MPSRNELPVSEGMIVRYWTASLVGGLVVIAAVAVLLQTLTRTAEQIQAGAAEIWRIGKLIANNTVHIPLLHRTNQHAATILKAADGIAAATTRIERAVVGDPTA